MDGWLKPRDTPGTDESFHRTYRTATAGEQRMAILLGLLAAERR
jgi:hypothetical protein